jgi:hypothetical protein
LISKDQTTLTGALMTSVGQLEYVTCGLSNQGTPNYLFDAPDHRVRDERDQGDAFSYEFPCLKKIAGTPRPTLP